MDHYHIYIYIYILKSKPHEWCNVSMLSSSSVDHGFEAQSGQAKDYGIGICCFSAKHAALNIRRKSQEGLAWNQDICLSGATCLSTDCWFSQLTQ